MHQKYTEWHTTGTEYSLAASPQKTECNSHSLFFGGAPRNFFPAGIIWSFQVISAKINRRIWNNTIAAVCC